jgi:spore coat polysaccharide biosynthesis protein SpsF (cytidylyltransferase family)
MNTVVIVQARMGSNRFPGKVLEKINGKPIVKLIIETLEKIKNEGHIDDFIFATPDTIENKQLWDFLKNQNIKVFKGSNNDVLDRFYQCAKQFKIDTIVRNCADAPFIKDWQIIQQIENFKKTNEFTYGNGSWVFSFKELEESWENGKHPEDREHVVTRMYKAVDYSDDLMRLQNSYKKNRK